jgi:predicted Zn finger-like uncharacterized protein
MIVQCANCQTKYNLPDAKIPEAGAKVKCSKCGNVFVAKKSAPPPPPPAPEPDLPDSLPDSLDDDLAGLGGGAPASPQPSSRAGDDSLDDLFSDSPSPAAPRASRPEPDGLDFGGDPFGSGSPDLDAPAGKPSGGFDLGESKPAKKKFEFSRKNLIILLAAGLLLLGGGGAAYFFLAKPEAPALPTKGAKANDTAQPTPGQAPPPVQPEAAAPPAQSLADKTKNISLKNVRQYYVTNEKAGPLFVVEGKALNEFTVPKEMIRVEVAIYDAQGRVLVSKKQLCGNTLSHFQLQVQTMEEIEKGLGAEVGILTNNTFVKPGADVPFMLVFANPPENLAEYGVNVVGAEDLSPEATQKQ